MRVSAQLFVLLTATCLSTAAFSQTAEPQQPPESKPVSIDKSKVFIGKRNFAVMVGGEQSGSSIVTTRFLDDGRFFIHDRSVSDAINIEEDIILVANGETFESERILVSGHFTGRFVNIDWNIEDSTANGEMNMFNPEDDSYRFIESSVELPEATLSRVASLYLANAIEMGDAGVLEFNWFSSMNGQLRPIRYELKGEQTVTVPAGTFDTYTIEQTGGQVSNIIYITKQAPHRIVRFDVPGTEIELHLTSLE